MYERLPLDLSAFQGAGSTLRVGFALLKSFHLHRAYLVTITFILTLAVNTYLHYLALEAVK